MSIDSPHGGGIDTPDSQDIWASIKKPSLPYGVSQKHWDKASEIVRIASEEIAQTLGEDEEPIWTLESRILKSFEDAELRMSAILDQLEVKLWWKFEREIQNLIQDLSLISNPKNRVTSVAILSPILDQKPTIIVNKENRDIELWRIIFTRLSYIYEIINTIEDEYERKRLIDIYNGILGKLIT